ncbi:hypothetical protein SLE2022_185740 [Rubroshorea leprosula]
MARLIRTAQRILLCNSSKSLLHGGVGSPAVASTSFVQSRSYASEVISKSPFEANILRILRNEIQYQSEYAPPHQPAAKFNSFTVQDRPGEQYITMRGKYGDNEDIKIDVTMFDGCAYVPKPGEDSTGEDVHLHISLLVDISKGQDREELEFLCSAWPDSLEIQKVYFLRREKMIAGPYMGPNFRDLNVKLQKTLREYLEARGVNDELSVFLHDYMKNKDRIELIQWLSTVKSFVEK